jgi:transposase
MFVRQKKNKSGLVSIQVIDKSSGKYKLVKTIGSSSNSVELEELESEAVLWIQRQRCLIELDFEQTDNLFELFIGGINQINVVGTELLLGKIFDAIGFNQIKDELFRKLVLARLCYPSSKLKTTEYLLRYENYVTDEDKIYRYLDKLQSKQKRQVQKISYDHTLGILGGEFSIVFYDVTTLYFEIKEEDELRKPGFSKDGKHQNPQIVLGLLVSTDGYPLAYEIYKGNKYEGDTMLPILNLFKRKYKLKKLVVVADAGLLSAKNIESLIKNNYEYILGARIKTEGKEIKEQIAKLKLKNAETSCIQKDATTKLIISYSDARAKKDAANRERGVAKLKKSIHSKKLTKAQINNKGYNKFLALEGEMEVSIDTQKIEEDAKWDGLKGYLTNTALSETEVIKSYNHLWNIEAAFRVSKSDLRIRPIYHQLQRRIEAHICLCFVAYKVYKELERQLKELKVGISPEKAIEIVKTIYCIKAVKPKSNEPFERILLLTEEQKLLGKCFGF